MFHSGPVSLSALDEDELSDKTIDLIENDLGSKRKFSSTHGSARRENVGVKPLSLNVQDSESSNE